MALLLDASTPALGAAANDPWSSGAFSPPDLSLIVLVCMGDSWTTGGGIPTLTPVATGLTFGSQIKSSVADQGCVQIFTAVVPAVGNISRTITCTTTNTSDVGGIKPFVFTGYDTTTPVDATSQGAFSADPSNTSLTVPTANSWVLGGGIEWNSTGLITSTDVIESYDDADLSFGCVRKAAQSAAGAVTLNYNFAGAPTGRWAQIAIKEASGPPPDYGIILLENGNSLLHETSGLMLNE